jgi:hypothetical protein
MLRALLAGILAVSAGASCKGGGDAPTFQPGAPAGSIIDLSGTATATRGTVVRPLELGAVVSGDDVIETAAGSRVAIMLTHNNVRWEIGPSRKAQVGTSMAWSLARQDKPSTRVDEETSAAGRHGEKTAATSATSTATAAPAADSPESAAAVPTAPPPSAAADPAPPPPAAEKAERTELPRTAVPAKAQRASVDRADADDKAATASAKPARAPRSAAQGALTLGDVGTNGRGGGTQAPDAGGGPTGATLEAGTPTVDRQVRILWARDRKALGACLDGARATVTFTVAKGVVVVDGTDAAITERTRTCFRAITTKWKITGSADAPVTVRLQLAK